MLGKADDTPYLYPNLDGISTNESSHQSSAPPEQKCQHEAGLKKAPSRQKFFVNLGSSLLALSASKAFLARFRLKSTDMLLSVVVPPLSPSLSLSLSLPPNWKRKWFSVCCFHIWASRNCHKDWWPSFQDNCFVISRSELFAPSSGAA